jgi:CTP:phosphocholine cytidylyltransferase-like protein
MKNTNTWSEALIARTYDILRDKNFMPFSDKMHLKNFNGQYAIIHLKDLLADNFILENAKTKEKTIFQNVDELVAAGWAVD